MPASEKALAWARKFWPEIDESEIDWQPVGRLKVTHRESGERLRIMLGQPIGGEESRVTQCNPVAEEKSNVRYERQGRSDYRSEQRDRSGDG